MSHRVRSSFVDRLVRSSSGAELVIPSRFGEYPEIAAAVSTRNGGVSSGNFGMNISMRVGDDPAAVTVNRGRILEGVGITEERIAHPGQVHGDRIVIVERGGRYPDCDALITPVAGIYLAITIADCVPVLLYDPVRKVVAAVHSGWRGSAMGILTKALGVLNGNFHVEARHIQAYIGPSAGVCCYEVGEEVAIRFENAYLRRSEGQRPMLDLKQFNRDVLLRSGVPVEQISVSAHCTICEGNLFHSYRREKETSGRMMALIGRKSA
jgi:YfiH family protein